MADLREILTIDAFVAGYPIRHSCSPIIHSHWLKTFEIAGSYKAVEVMPSEFPAFIATVKAHKPGAPVGGNITIPHKEAAYRLADKPDDLAEELGAANTLWMEGGQLCATNTDGFGFVSNLDECHPGWDKTGRAIVLGAGGASRAVIQSLKNRGVSEIHVLNRTFSRARQVSDRFGNQVFAHPLEALQEVIQGAGLLVNTTSLGMDGAATPHFDLSRMDKNAVVTDIVYFPLKTPILRMAEEVGLVTVDGLGMLLHQARPGFSKWFGKIPQVDDNLRSIIIEAMDRHG